jgi:acetyl esterase/lipase
MVHLPARDIPVPTSVSPEAQAALAMGHLGPPHAGYPALDDVDGWKAYVAEADGFMRTMVGETKFPCTIEERDLGPCPLYVVTPDGLAADDRRVLLDIHGGAWILGSGDLCRMTGSLAATAVGARTWAVDYRMPPDHPYPAAVDDCLTAYRALLEERRPEEILVGGASAGGNLAAALVLRARDEGLPLPAGVLVNTGAFDLTSSGDTWQTNDGLDNVLQGSASGCVDLYAAGHDPREPYISPLYGDLTGFPPTIFLTGTRDMLLSDNVRMHRALRAAGVNAELHVWEAAGHGGFLGMAPEDQDRFGEMRRFANEQWTRAGETAGASAGHGAG